MPPTDENGQPRNGATERYERASRTAQGHATLSLSTPMQLGALLSIILAAASYHSWVMSYVQAAVKSEETARLAEVGGQVIQRTADMARLQAEHDVSDRRGTENIIAIEKRLTEKIDALDRRVTVHHAQFGHDGVVGELRVVQGQFATETALRVGAEHLAIANEQALSGRVDILAAHDDRIDRSIAALETQVARIGERVRTEP